jgi:hypothetical protein
MLTLLIAESEAFSQEADTENWLLIRVGTGLYDVRRENAPAFRQAEIGFWHDKNTLQPFVGFILTTTKDTYGYLGLLAEVPFTDRIQVLLRLAGGLYTRGRGIDLGFPFEFRSEVELAWQWTSQSRIGLALSHLSNGALSKANPGLEMLGVTYSVTR